MWQDKNNDKDRQSSAASYTSTWKVKKTSNFLSSFQHLIVIGLTVQIVLFFVASLYLPAILSHPVAVAGSPLPAEKGHHVDIQKHGGDPLQAGLLRSYPNSPHHNPMQKRRCFSFTAVPKEIDKLFAQVEAILKYERYSQVLDCIHLVVPDRSIRFGGDAYPSTQELLSRNTDPRIIITRTSFDYGPMTRYLGPLHFEKHPETSVILFDIDSDLMLHNPNKDLVLLYFAAEKMDATAMWCYQGENFFVDDKNVVHSAWDTYNATLDHQYNLWYNECHFCRGVGGLLFKIKQFADFWWNQTEYHESCFWDDDRWVSYQMERQGFPMKVLHAPGTGDSSSSVKAKWYDVSRQITRNVVSEDIRMKETRVESTEERQENERLAEARLQRNDKRPRVRMRERLIERKRIAEAMLQHRNTTSGQTDETKKHPVNHFVSGRSENQSSSDHRRMTASDWHVQQHGQSHKADALEDVSSTSLAFDENPMPDNRVNNDVAGMTTSQIGMLHRRLGSLTQITMHLVSDQTCPLAWLSKHPNAYPSARSKRKDPIVHPIDSLTVVRGGQMRGAGLHRSFREVP